MSTMIEKPFYERANFPEFRGLLLEYVREVSGNEAQAAVLAQEDEVEVLKPSGGFVLQESEGRAYVNLCIESKTKGLWSIPYAMPSSSRPHANADGSIAALYDVLFHPSALKKASRNRRSRWRFARRPCPL
ncbi:Dynein_ axonemal_ assembly factor 2, partial [Caligus rogercresseyi]